MTGARCRPLIRCKTTSVVATPSHAPGRFVILLIACFNVFDCVGRMLLSIPALIPRNNPKRWLVVLMLMRLVFFPLFLWRALPSMGNNSDAYAFIVVALFSASNGFVGTLAMQEGPQHCKFAPPSPIAPPPSLPCPQHPLPSRENDREVAGTVLAFCLMVGARAEVARAPTFHAVLAAGGTQLGRSSGGCAECHLVFKAGRVLKPASLSSALAAYL
jgi:hypothetical protein